MNRLIAEIQARYRVRDSVSNALEYLQHRPAPIAGMGHNNPPEDITEDPLPEEDVAFVKKILQNIAEETEKPKPDVEALQERQAELRLVNTKIAGWLAKKLDLAVDVVVKMLAAGGVLKLAGPLSLYFGQLWIHLQSVYDTVAHWISSLT